MEGTEEENQKKLTGALLAASLLPVRVKRVCVNETRGEKKREENETRRKARAEGAREREKDSLNPIC